MSRSLSETELSATTNLTNYLTNSELIQSNSSSPITIKENEINQQLNDLKIQFKNGIQRLNNKEFQLQPSLSMPHLPPYALKSKQRKKPRPLTPSHLLHTDINSKKQKIKIFNDTSTTLSSSTSSSSSLISSPNSQYYPSSIVIANNNNQNINNENKINVNSDINNKLDLLINIVHSQQEILQKLVSISTTNYQNNIKKKSKKKKKEKILLKEIIVTSSKKEKEKQQINKCIQTERFPYIICDPESKQSSIGYPPIPQINHNNNGNNISNGNVSMPYNMLLKLIQSATNKVQHSQSQSQPQSHKQHTCIPQVHIQQHPNTIRYQNPQWIPTRNINNHENINNNENMMSPKSTLHFSEC